MHTLLTALYRNDAVEILFHFFIAVNVVLEIFVETIKLPLGLVVPLDGRCLVPMLLLLFSYALESAQ
jgi:hypothetical protein